MPFSPVLALHRGFLLQKQKFREVQQLVQGDTARMQNAKIVRSFEFGVIGSWVQILAILLTNIVTIGRVTVSLSLVASFACEVCCI